MDTKNIYYCFRFHLVTVYLSVVEFKAKIFYAYVARHSDKLKLYCYKVRPEPIIVYCIDGCYFIAFMDAIKILSLQVTQYLIKTVLLSSNLINFILFFCFRSHLVAVYVSVIQFKANIN